MTWKPLKEPNKKDISRLNREYKKKARFLVDESLGFSVTKFLRDEGWNVKDISEVGLSGHSDEDVFAYSHKDDRVLLTHDDDFLNDRRFPPHRNPGLVVLPGASGDEIALIRALMRALSIVGTYRELYRGAKIIFASDGSMSVWSRNRDSGAMEKKNYRFPKHGMPLEWKDERDINEKA